MKTPPSNDPPPPPPPPVDRDWMMKRATYMTAHGGAGDPSNHDDARVEMFRRLAGAAWDPMWDDAVPVRFHRDPQEIYTTFVGVSLNWGVSGRYQRVYTTRWVQQGYNDWEGREDFGISTGGHAVCDLGIVVPLDPFKRSAWMDERGIQAGWQGMVLCLNGNGPYVAVQTFYTEHARLISRLSWRDGLTCAGVV